MNNQAILSNKPLNAEFFAMLEGHVNTPVYLDDCTMINYVWMFNEYNRDWDKFDVDLVHTDAIINIRSLADVERIAELEKVLENFLPMDDEGGGWDFQYNAGSEHLGQAVIEVLQEQEG